MNKKLKLIITPRAEGQEGQPGQPPQERPQAGAEMAVKITGTTMLPAA